MGRTRAALANLATLEIASTLEALAPRVSYQDMKLLPLLVLVAACSAHVDIHGGSNLATQAVLVAEPDSKCTDLYLGQGPDITYTSVCRLPNKQVIYVSLDIKNGFQARSLSGGAPAATPPAPPAPVTATGSGSGQ